MSKVSYCHRCWSRGGFTIAKRLVQDGFRLEYWTTMLKQLKKRIEVVRRNTLQSLPCIKTSRSGFPKVVDHFGDLNVVVNSAGVAPTTPLDTITRRTIYVHLLLTLVA